MNISLTTVRNLAVLLVICFVTHAGIQGIGSAMDSAHSNLDANNAKIEAIINQ